MKRQSLGSLFGAAIAGWLAATAGLAQTADQLVAEGRGFLSSRNITNANARFAAALAVDANHESANLLHAATRALNLPLQPAGAAFLTRLGFPLPGRDIYNWTARIPSDPEGVPNAPAGVSAQELPWQLRTNALLEIQGALLSLSRITNPNFALGLTAAETTTDAVTVDYADVQMLRAGLHFMEYLCFTLHSQNLDAQLTALRSMHTNGTLNAETVLTQYPALFTYATTNDLAAARTAFENLVDRYNDASDRLRLRMALTRLFNLDEGGLNAEVKFRETLNELRQTLSSGPVALSHYEGHDYDQFLVDLSRHFSGQHPWRSQLPAFRGGRMALGTLPEPVLGGVLSGFSRDQAEDYVMQSHSFAGRIQSPTIGVVPGLTVPSHSGGAFSVNLRATRDRAYALQINTNLTNPAGWQDVGGAFFAEGSSARLEDATAAGAARRFYRVVERSISPFLPPANNDFVNRTVLSGFPAFGRGHTQGAFSEGGEPSHSNGRGRTIWYSWTAPSTTNVVALTGGFPERQVDFYTGSSLGTLAEVGSAFIGSRRAFPVTSGITYAIRVDELFFYTYQSRGFPVVLTAPLTLTLSGVAQGAVFASPASITLTATATAPVRWVEFFDAVDTKLTNAPYSLVLTNLLPGDYEVGAYAENQQGLSDVVFKNFTVTGPAPANDTFANRIVLSGSTAANVSYTGGATVESGEPNFGPSIWWEWVAPKSGLVTVSTRGSYALINQLAVYTGTALNSLARVGRVGYGPRENESRVRFIAAAGTSYKISVAGNIFSTGTIRLAINQP